MSAFDGVHGTVCNETQYDQSLLSSDSRTPSISCLTHGQSTGLAVSICLSVLVSNLSHVQLTAEASVLSCMSIIVIFIWMGVRPTSFHISVLFDEVLHSGTYDGIERRSQGVTGSCSRGLLTSTWSA
jgi:hypothetical protein